jgi:glyoxylase-like metal-dependent hydrolase (beta-lactamase superfamily II)
MEAKAIVHQMELGEMANFVYLVACKTTKEAAVVDPGWDVPDILLTAARYGLTITKILLTHTHHDHINGVALVRERTKAPLHVHALEAKGLDATPSPLVELQDGDTIALGDVTLSVLHTPGHSPGLVCFHVGDDLICGDVLFVGAIGRIDLRGADPRAMYQSLARLKGAFFFDTEDDLAFQVAENGDDVHNIQAHPYQINGRRIQIDQRRFTAAA